MFVLLWDPQLGLLLFAWKVIHCNVEALLEWMYGSKCALAAFTI